MIGWLKREADYIQIEVEGKGYLRLSETRQYHHESQMMSMELHDVFSLFSSLLEDINDRLYFSWLK